MGAPRPLPLAPSPLIGSCAELITSSCPAPSAQIFEGKGQVKVTRMNRELSEHASSIWSDEEAEEDSEVERMQKEKDDEEEM